MFVCEGWVCFFVVGACLCVVCVWWCVCGLVCGDVGLCVCVVWCVYVGFVCGLCVVCL